MYPQAGKKKVKAVTRALQKAHRSPRVPSYRQSNPQARDTAQFTLTPSHTDKALDATETNGSSTPRAGTKPPSVTRPTPIPRSERQPLRTPGARFSEHVGSYGSILATPPHHGAASDTASFELPDPALDPDEEYTPPEENGDRPTTVRTPSPVMDRHATFDISPSQPMPDSPPVEQRAELEQRPSYQSPLSGALTRVASTKRGSHLLRRVFSHTEGEMGGKRSQPDGSEIDKRQDEFFEFLDNELTKIDSFYQMKEQEATDKLRVLRQQLHIMRDQRIQEVLVAKRAAKSDGPEAQQRPNGFVKLNSNRLKDTLVGKNRFGKNSEALAEMAAPGMHAQDREFISNRRDFMRRQDPPSQEVSYRSAKRKLKHALQEFYRGVELLKGYAYLNRTAFRKINKKYDKAVSARPSLRYMSEKVNKAAFVQSEVIESLMVAVEDLYARYFERGNRKIAVSKLRHTIKKSGDYSPNTFRSGLLLMGGTLFSIKSLVDATRNLRTAELDKQVQTNFLLQVGVFLYTV